ncbi:ATP-dependent DNA ligase (EC LigC [Olavius algarvensis Delta 1 endosymbiont]|nr:ATP-dependent DNA ligase (EC LigC [Olavius algarvensis Delta 1 endosymbiont]
MKDFAGLYRRLDETTSTNRKIEAMVDYFRRVTDEDAIWAISFLIGRKPRRVIPTRKLMQWAAELADVPDWLFDASYEVVGDLAETITLLLPEASGYSDRSLHEWIENYLLPLRDMEADSQRDRVLNAWHQMTGDQRFVYNKLITGGFRVGVSRRLVVRALERCSGIEAAVIFHRLMGEWPATRQTYRRLLSPDTRDADNSRPYPFYLAYPLEGNLAELGDLNRWQVEWKWDGIRGQVINRGRQVFIWSRGEELVTEKYPELREAAAQLPDGTVMDGEILAWKAGRPLPFSELQRRIGRKKVGKKLLEEVPVGYMAYDVLEFGGNDLRRQALTQRREILARLLSNLSGDRLILSPVVTAGSWQNLAVLREDSRRRGVEGFMVKRLDSGYEVGRRRGYWWKWKIDPFTADAVLIYARRGHGRRAGLYTDYTFAVWQGDSLVPFAKAYSGLNNEEIRRVDRFVQRNTLERFGPVRSVRPELVFEIAFEGIRQSSRHKSGLAVRFPRIARWRTDKSIEEADTIETLKTLLSAS